MLGFSLMKNKLIRSLPNLWNSWMVNIYNAMNIRYCVKNGKDR